MKSLRVKHVMFLSIIPFILFYSGCTKIFEADLSSSTIIINMPIDNYVHSSSYVQFWWDEVEDAEKYSIQIVKPNFDTISTLIVDTNLSGNKFEWSFSPGKYQWRIKACNSTSCTNFQLYSFEVDSSLDLSGSKTVLVLPTSDKYINSKTIKFSWLKQYFADYYYFSIFDKNNYPVIYNNKVYKDYLYLPSENLQDSLPDGNYKWEVTAVNSNSIGIKGSANFTIDRTKPTPPNLIKPFNNMNQSSTLVSFQWDNGSDVNYCYDSLMIYVDTNIVLFYRSYISNLNIITDTIPIGSYYWYVKTLDKAGNLSEISEVRKFIIN